MQLYIVDALAVNFNMKEGKHMNEQKYKYD